MPDSWPPLRSTPAIGLGCMRLSTDADRDDARSVRVLHAAFDAGVTFLDTSNAYCLDDRDAGHNERLIARAIASWQGDRSQIVVATKGGLTRPAARWVPDGRARHLAEACNASRRALGLERLPLYQLHAPDPRTPFATSVRALASLQRDGLIERVGLCNVTVAQIEDARGIVDIATVQVEMNPWNDDAFLSGVAEYCAANGIRLIAHRPLGGVQKARRVLKDRVFVDLARQHGVTPYEIALAWLTDLSPVILAVPGATRVETAQSIAVATAVTFSDADRSRLDERFATAASLRSSRRGVRTAAGATRQGEVALIMGLPGAGKTTLAQTFVNRGYARLNRDDAGGSLRGLAAAFGRLMETGASRVVLDNTYISRKSRAPVVQAAAKAGLAVRCIWLATGIEDAQVNAVWRMWSTYGRVLDPEEMRTAVKRGDISAFPPSVLFRYQRELEPPDPSEGFANIERVAFVRDQPRSAVNGAVLVSCEDVLARSRSGARAPVTADDVQIVETVASELRRFASEGWRVLGVSWRPEIHSELPHGPGEVAHGFSRADSEDVAHGFSRADSEEAAHGSPVAQGFSPAIQNAEAIFARIRELLDVAIDIRCCPHAGGPPVCWCRKPLPGLGVAFVRQYELDPGACIYIGAGPHDAGFARRLGFQWRPIA
jgi:aryl-alcohol dehydrogenase-like predicted oxidoreductase